MGLEGKRAVALAEEVVNRKEAGFLGQLLGLLGKTKKNKLIQTELDGETTRLNPTGKHDQEEVFAGTGKYTSGRKDHQRPKLSTINTDQWPIDGV